MRGLMRAGEMFARRALSRCFDAIGNKETTMDGPADMQQLAMETTDIVGTPLKASRVAIGTWAIGGWMWGGSEERKSISTILAAADHGIKVIDTAPAYGFGRSEEIVGKAIAAGNLRARTIIATKVGLGWA